MPTPEELLELAIGRRAARAILPPRRGKRDGEGAGDVVTAVSTNPVAEQALAASGVTGTIERRIGRALTPPQPPVIIEEGVPVGGLDITEDIRIPPSRTRSISRRALAAPETPATTEGASAQRVAPTPDPGHEFPIGEQSRGPAQRGIDEGLRDQAKVERAAGEEAAIAMERAESRIQEQDLQTFQAMQQVADKQARRVAEMDAQLTEMRTTRFDANRLFSGADAATQFGAALGIAVGDMIRTTSSILFPGSNATNRAQQIINDAIDRDIRTQVQQFQQGSTVAGQQRTAMTLARQAGLDSVAAQAFARDKALEEVQRHLTRLAVRHQGTQAEFRLRQAAEGFRLQQAEVARIWNLSARQAMMQQTTGARPAPAFNDFTRFARFNPENPDAQRIYDAYMERAGSSGLGTIRDEVMGNSQLVTLVDDIRREMADLDSVDMVVGARSAALESMAAQLAVIQNRAGGLGALDAQSLELLKQISGNPSELWQRRALVDAKLRTVRRQAIRNVHARAEPLTAAGGMNPPVLLLSTPVSDTPVVDETPLSDEERTSASSQATRTTAGITETAIRAASSLGTPGFVPEFVSEAREGGE